uniref:(California timema) hypothetical protein n=1 Tax=Timema californicum TaxID=61474 RepID=A0A7R9P405_TIMCA|nr:unnamed protein product [Timema californicum]
MIGVLSTEMELNSGSRTEFISADILENPIEYGRTGGWFFSFTKVVVFVLTALTVAVLTGVIVYFSFPCSRVEVDCVVLYMPNSRIAGSSSEPGSDRLNGTSPSGSPDGLDSTTSVPVTDLRLPDSLIPLHYKLRVQPFIEESSGDNFTFQGHVTITVNVRAPAGTTLINVHAKNLNIPDKEVSITLLTTPDTKEEVTETSPPTTVRGVINSDANLTTEVADVTQAPNSVESSSSTENTIVSKKSKPNKKGKKTKREINSETISSKNNRDRRSKEESSSGYIPGPPRIVYAVRDLIKDMYIVHVEPPLIYGNNYTIDIPFSGVLSNTLSGFYRSSYTDIANGQNRWIAATHFRTTHAREAFPCMDEPVMKASFEISVGRRVNMTSISNMPIKRTEKMEKHPEWMWDHFYKTPAMPTYLVSYAVAHSDFKVATKNSSGQPTKVTLTKPQDTVTQVSVVASSEAVPLADYVLAITPKILRFFGEYLGVPYPLPKLDMFAIPDFSLAAVQDWGLITFRESELLFNVSTTLMKQELAVVLSHQIALQWFGDLVTAKGWNDLWVNEGFASYMDHTAVNYAEPSWELSDQFLLDHLLPALAADSLGTSHAISVGEKVLGASDKVSYDKGIILVLDCPADDREMGVRILVGSFSNADTDDLWSSLTNQSRLSKDADILLPPNVTLKEVMSGWTMQPGYPVLTVTRDYGKGFALQNIMITPILAPLTQILLSIFDDGVNKALINLIITLSMLQSRFTLEDPTEASSSLWYIPVSYMCQTENKITTKPRVWLNMDSEITLHSVTKPGPKEWVLFNLGMTGFYRVNYDERNWELLTNHLMNTKEDQSLPLVTKAQLLDDALNLARAGHLEYPVALNLTRYLALKERNYVPWVAAMENLGHLRLLLRDSSSYITFQKYLQDLMSPIYNELSTSGKAGESRRQSLLRIKILTWMSDSEAPEVLSWAQKLYTDWIDSSSPHDDNPVPVDQQRTVYCTAIRHGGMREWDFAYQRLRVTLDPGLRNNLIDGLSCTRDPGLLVTLLEKCMEIGGVFKLHNAHRIWDNMIDNPVGSTIALNYVRGNWGRLKNRFANAELGILRNVLKGSIGGLTNELDYANVLDFQATNKGNLAYAEKYLEEEIILLKLRITWRKKYKDIVAKWLHHYLD